MSKEIQGAGDQASDGDVVVRQLRKKLDAFIAAGNKVTGFPEKIEGTVEFWFKGTGSHLHFGKGCQIKDMTISMRWGSARISFGDKAKVWGYFRAGKNCSIAIGDRTKFNRRCEFVAWEQCSIDVAEDCLFSNIMLRTCDSHSIFDASTMERINPSRSIIIERHVWLSENVSIQKGVIIGSDTVVAANSLVSRSLGRGVLAAGTPAKPIRTGITWSDALKPMQPQAPKPIVVEQVKDEAPKKPHHRLLRYLGFRW